MVAGGAQIYAAGDALRHPPGAHRGAPAPSRGDTVYPAWDRAEWRETAREEHDGHTFVWLERAG